MTQRRPVLLWSMAALVVLLVVGGLLAKSELWGEDPEPPAKTVATKADEEPPAIKKEPKPPADETPAGEDDEDTPQPTDLCPEGMTFIRGTHGAKFKREGKQRDIDDFCLDTTEVTVAAFREHADEEWLKETKTDHEWCNGGHHDREDHPINCVSAKQAAAHCKELDHRLPTEWEWEWAARGRENGHVYPWGKELPDHERVNACGPECVAEAKRLGRDWIALYEKDDGFKTTAPVGSKPKGNSRDGLQDMSGNVWEWTSSDYNSKGSLRVVRGGGWFDELAANLRASYRISSSPSDRFYFFGFRCSRTK